MSRLVFLTGRFSHTAIGTGRLFFSYSYWDRAIVNYDELETELEEYLKKVRKDGRPPAGIDG